METNVPILEVRGTPWAMGRVHGEANREIVRQVVEGNIRNLHEIFKRKSLTYLPRDRYLSLAARYLPFAQEYAPDLVEEIQGLAEATGIDSLALFAHNCFLELDDLAYPFLADHLLFGCSTFAVSNRVTADGRSYLGENYDMRSVFKDTGIVLHLKPTRGPAAIVWTLAGMLGCAGINAAGIAVVINNLVPSDSRPGVPYPFIVRKVLQQERLGDAVAAIVGARRATGIHYVLADASGQVIALETTATNYEPIHPVEGYLAHANHYLTMPLRPYERFRLPYSTDSIVRYGRMLAMLQERAGHIGMENMQQFLVDHVNHPFSICRHEAEDADEELLGKTIGSVIMDPAGRRLYVTTGNPCETRYETLTCV